MNNLCYGMKVIAISQMPGGSYSHPNGAMDLFGCDSDKDFWWAQGCWKCIAGPWGAGTYFFVSCSENGVPAEVHCADGIYRIVTLALTHSNRQYVQTTVGKIYKNGQPMYEEGTNSNGSVAKITGNHIHLEVAAGIQTTKTYDKSMKVYRMANELDPLKVMYVNKAFSIVRTTEALYRSGKALLFCDKLTYDPPKPAKKEDIEVLYFVADTMSCYVRKSLTFNALRRNSSTVLATIPKGGKAKITHFTERHEKDGYEWVQVDYKGIAGYCQLDTKAYKVEWE